MFQVLLPTHEPHILPTIQMLARALEDQGIPCYQSPLRHKRWRALAKAASLLNIRRIPFHRQGSPFFAQLNHTWPNAFYPYFLNRPLISYSFDLWPYTWDAWERVFRYTEPRIAFISAKLPLVEMQRRLPLIDFRWLPEAVDPSGFDPSLTLDNRPIDVLEVGRPFPQFHEKIKVPLENAVRRHQYPIAGGKDPSAYDKTVSMYSKAKVTLVFPRSITHPGQAQGVETTTFRYFECMASKTLMLGHCPNELMEIFGYNPVIEANLDNPAEQIIREILPAISNYQNLVDKNYEMVCSTWTVHHQALVIKHAMHEIITQ